MREESIVTLAHGHPLHGDLRDGPPAVDRHHGPRGGASTLLTRRRSRASIILWWFVRRILDEGEEVRREDRQLVLLRNLDDPVAVARRRVLVEAGRHPPSRGEGIGSLDEDVDASSEPTGPELLGELDPRGELEPSVLSARGLDTEGTGHEALDLPAVLVGVPVIDIETHDAAGDDGRDVHPALEVTVTCQELSQPQVRFLLAYPAFRRGILGAGLLESDKANASGRKELQPVLIHLSGEPLEGVPPLGLAELRVAAYPADPADLPA